METYHNDYSKEDDPMMWKLHEIRHKMALENISPDEMNQRGDAVIKRHNLKLKVLGRREMGLK